MVLMLHCLVHVDVSSHKQCLYTAIWRLIAHADARMSSLCEYLLSLHREYMDSVWSVLGHLLLCSSYVKN